MCRLLNGKGASLFSLKRTGIPLGAHLHHLADPLALSENLCEGLCSQNVTKCRLGEKPRGIGSILHVCDRDHGVAHPVVDHSIHRNSYRVFGEDLKHDRNGSVREALKMYTQFETF